MNTVWANHTSNHNFVISDEQTLTLIQTFTGNSSPELERTLRHRQRHQLSYNLSPKLPSQDEVFKFKDWVKDDLAMGPLDKSSATLDVMCPVILWNLMKLHFWENTSNYTRSKNHPSAILQGFKSAFHEKKWCSFSKINTNGTLPYPYLLRKSKDLQRIRPIVS
jgi:hypothetical protein